MIYKESYFKFWEDEGNETIEDFYALDVLRFLTKDKIENGTLLNDAKLSGRVNSSINETEIIKIFNSVESELLKYDIKLDTKEGKASIQDFKLIFKEREVLTNIKITTGLAADNATSFKVVNYVLTGKMISNKSQFLKDTKFTINKNYYFFVVNKITKKIIINSLRTLAKLTPNPSNPPFQIRWAGENEKPDLENIDHSGERLIRITRISILKDLENKRIMANNLSKLIGEEELEWKQ